MTNPYSGLAKGDEDRVYGSVNKTLLALLGAVHGRVLDVGCGSGELAAPLRAAGAEQLVALDISPGAIEAARPRYDTAALGAVEELELPDVGGVPFDLVVAADVLEHLVDPWAALRRLRGWAAPGCRLAVSVPNVRYAGIVLPLLLRGRFDYDRRGNVMDITHLRWFTRSSLDASLRATGWEPAAWGDSRGPKRKLLGALTLGTANDLLRHQLYVVAVAS